MNVLLTMSLAGSLMMVVYAILKFLLDERFYPELRHVCLSISMVYFLIPFPLALEEYRYFLIRTLGIQTKFSQIIYENQQFKTELFNVVQITERGKVLYVQNKSLILFIFFTISLVCIVFDRQLRGFLKARKLVLQDSICLENQEVIKLLEQCKTQVGVRRKVELRKWNQKTSPFTMGVFHPCIVITDYPLSYQEYEMIFLHELYHIKNHDVFFKFLMLITMSINWYNPVVYYLRSEMNLVYELVSDESLLKDKDAKFLKRYGSFIIDMATESIEQSLDFSVAMSKPGKEIQHRLKIAFHERGKSKSLVVALKFVIVIAMLFNSMSVLAYEPMQKIVFSENFSGENNFNITSDPFVFNNVMEKGIDFTQPYSTMLEDDVTVNVCFQDEQGIQYKLESIIMINNEKSDLLEHQDFSNMIAGKYLKHISNIEGGCKILVYEGFFDVNKKQVIVTNLFSENVYVECSHKE